MVNAVHIALSGHQPPRVVEPDVVDAIGERPIDFLGEFPLPLLIVGGDDFIQRRVDAGIGDTSKVDGRNWGWEGIAAVPPESLR